ncbi:monocarboxylate transporter 5 [Anoplophora glabripennis]|uniref:monocarboxylate transporter 5 n=1 Tax=Anoplophora glabripennis TaxID=217634 RepID=UPI00087525FF|nr:monocarboxylate transporter 5 [Anoplophora glabripennis]XP_018573021.1 monocarboxylate transporter 5 [Anoplophora glabripennis]XP_018573022.1 monocarboxylate transporter 5 [Anoplophora glabripennis]XP_018573023.1 monocarboxylate transporter 5 [Anoplophora glabripennis]
MFIEQKKLVPPDGGWGWIVVIGVSLVNLCTRSIEPSFGLLFGDLLKEMGIETTGAAIIMSTLDALINFSGLFVGPLIRAFSYRKVSLIGSALCGLGLILTYPASTMAHLLCTYSIINGLGVGLTASSTFVALNNYFVKRRGQAVGFSLAGTAFGMMLMPQAVKFLLDSYNFRGAILILGAFALNGIVGSTLLQPAKWHFVPEAKDEEEGGYHQEMETIKETEDEDAELAEGQTLINNKIISELGIKTLEELTKPGLTRKSTFPRNFSTMSFTGNRKRKTSIDSISNISRLDFTGSSIQLQFDGTQSEETTTYGSCRQLRRNMSYPGVQISPQHKFLQQTHTTPVKQTPKKSTWQKIVVFMDFDLLKDPIYLNLVFGLSIFYVAEQNFKMVTPFFFQDIGYDKSDVALFLSVQALTDILARLILPPICDRLTISKRTLFMTGIFVLGICRSVLAEQTEWTMIMVWLFICGFFRGAALINFTITISEYSSLEKLPAAFGLHMVGKGLFVVIFGPILGQIRDSTKSFPICLHSQTFFIMLCCLAWTIEYLIKYFRTRSAESDTDTTTT